MNSKTKIFITGGTFDKEYNELTGELYFNYTHMHELLKLGRCKVNVDIETIMMVDSLDMTETQRTIIVQKCMDEPLKTIIITHGTDTLSFTSSALSQYFYNFNKPVILVSSDKPIKEKNATGKKNLEAAINFILKIKLQGTYVSYKNPKESSVSFYLGSRVKQINAYDNVLNARYSGIFCNFKN